MIISGGENIHPLEVEDVARAPSEGAARSRSSAPPDDRLGQRVVACVVADPGTRPPRSSTRSVSSSPALARFKRPREYRFVEELPEEPVGQDPPPHAERREPGLTTSYDGFRVERDETRGVATITLDVPEKMNRVSMPAREQLAAVFDELGADGSIRAIVFTGAGEKAFTAGGDIPGFLEREPGAPLAARLERRGARALPEARRRQAPRLLPRRRPRARARVRLPRRPPTISQLGLPEVGLGMIPGSGGTQRLARLIGLGRAKDVIMRRKRISAADALAWGLVSEVVPPGELDAAVDRVVDELLELSPLALAMAKRVLNHAYDGPLHVGLELEGLAYGLLRSSHDFREGVEAFVEKRKPEWEGR